MLKTILFASAALLVPGLAAAQLGPLSHTELGKPNGPAQLDPNGRASALTILPTGTTAPISLADRAATTLDVRNYGAACDGVTNDHAAINAAIAAAAARPAGGQVFFPRLCRTDSSTGPILALSHVTLRGPGRGRGGILVDDTAAGAGTGIVNGTGGLLQDFHVRDMTISGMRATVATLGQQSIELDNADDISVEDSDLVQSRNMGLVIQRANHVTVRGNRVYHTNADGIAVWDSGSVLITGNTIEGANDDAISAHSNDATTGPVRSGVTITDNVITESQGIDVLGGKGIVIARNTLRRVMAYGIVARVSGTSQGDTAVFGLRIADNIITDVFRRPETPYLNQEQYYIRVGGGPRVAAGAGSAPGVPTPGTGAVPSLFGPDGVGTLYANNVLAGGSVAGAGGYWVDITGNQLLRTLPAVAAYSDWGYNAALFVGYVGPANGLYDGPITEAELNTQGIEVEPSLRNSRISGNTIQTTGPYAINFDQSATWTNGDLDGLLVEGNKLVDYSISGMWLNVGGTAQRLLVRNNEFDGDPRFASPNRGPHGTWATLSGAGEVPEGVLVGASGMVALGNTFRNLAAPLLNNVPYNAVARSNIVYANPSAVGASTANVGVGVLPADGPEYSYVIEDGDPTSATYGQMLSPQVSSAAAQPTNGTYVAGHIVYNSAPSTSVVGWLRLTTGNGNVAGTDWAVIDAAAPTAPTPTTVALTLTPGSGALGAGATASLTYVRVSPLVITMQISVALPNLGTVPAGASLLIGGFPFQVAGACMIPGRENAVTGKGLTFEAANGATGASVSYYDNTSPVVAGASITASASCPTYN